MKVIFCILLAFVASYRFAAVPYEHSQELYPDRFTVYWTVNLEQSEINLAVRANTEDGWVGFGIAEFTTGAMPGADIVMLTFEDGIATLSDRHALKFASPIVDKCQDWTLIGGEREGGYTTFHLSRKFNTGDPQDRELIEGENRVIWAIGPSADVRIKHPSDTDHRGSTVVTFWGDQIPWNDTDPLIKTQDMLMPAFVVPHDRVTNYVCQSFTLDPVDDAHIIRIDPLVEKKNEGLVHHFLVHLCEKNTYWEKYTEAKRCSSPLGDLESGCTGLMFAWAVGGGSTYLPELAGFPMGTNSPHGAAHVILEVHYDNRLLQPGLVDSSGVRIHYTPQKRQYDAAMMTLGDMFVGLAPIPPRLPYYEYETDCPSECTSGWDHDIHVFADFLHMHEVGKQIWSTHHREEEYLGIFNRADFFEFDWQQIAAMDKIIKVGDRINTHCVFDTTERAEETRFGPDSKTEMCMEFISYYPALFTKKAEPYTYCGFVKIDSKTNATMCGASEQDIKWMSNPTKWDVPGTGEYDFGKPCEDAHTHTLTPKNKIPHEVPTAWIIGGCVVGALVGVLAIVFIIRRFSRRSEVYESL